ncbi:MAG: winged helix-turn-helix domain-containing protein [Oscillospiraceae bacterium]|jgi:ArsR family transcriptional regulator|nr:winged helix-turn-helix domain-containing protein [Oscillospiraceae bacterium]
MDLQAEAEAIKTGFIKCQKLLIAIGDETRQSIIAALMEAGCEGLRVGEITAKTHLSRPAVSHHVKILLDCGLIGLDRQGTKNFYYLVIGDGFMNLCDLVNRITRFRDAADCQEADHAI